MIYLDNAATSKPLEAALKAAEKFNSDLFFNPSALYGGGVANKNFLNSAREELLSFFPEGYEAIFTSGGTEADNLAVFSFGTRGNFVTTAGEHSAVYESFNELKKRGADVRFAPLNKDGSVNADALLGLTDENTTFVSVVHVNNETGAINDISKIARMVKSKNPRAVFHSDGVQAFGKLSVKSIENVDLYSVSAHKVGGIKGAGALIKRKGVSVKPLIFGGGQEFSLRSGTENIFGICVFSEAIKALRGKTEENFEKVAKIKKDFAARLDPENITVISGEVSSPYILSVSAVGLRGEVVQHMMEENGVIIGTGSACSSRSRHSRILKECGYTDKFLDGALRISFSRDTDHDEAIYAADKLNENVARLKEVMKK